MYNNNVKRGTNNMTNKTALITLLIIFILTVCANTTKHSDYYTMTTEELQSEVETGELELTHGYVVEKTSEGGSVYDDYYLVNINSELYEVEADDLSAGDVVTVYFKGSETVRTLQGWK